MNKHLLPREHGAYAELGFPLLTGLVLGTPAWPAWHFVAVGARRRLRPTVCQATTLAIAARTVLGRRLFALAGDPLTKRSHGRDPSPVRGRSDP